MSLDGIKPFTINNVGYFLVPYVELTITPDTEEWNSAVALGCVDAELSCGPYVDPYLHLSMFIFLGSVKLSVQNKRSSITFIPVISLPGLVFAK